MLLKYFKFSFLLLSVLLGDCVSRQENLFVPLDSAQTGINFSNNLFISDTVNAVSFEYIYNGAGVAVGDFNNDGLKDLFFAGNMVSSKLFLNKGKLQFRDVSSAAEVKTDRWCTGTSAVDINKDGLLDIYICVAGSKDPEVRKNIFFINQGVDKDGIPHFRDKAPEMGVNDDGYSTMAVFLDYDKDNDLDLYILTNAMEGAERNAIRNIKKNGEAASTDRLYRNNGDNTFSNVSREAGILIEGLGLGVKVCDINQDGWPDIYCSDDFISNDLLWINNMDGTFTDKSGEYFKHFTYSGMGMDIADYNNDGLPDVFVLDMMPVTNLRQKLMIGYRNLNKFYTSLDSGYHPQFMRNTLQLNRGKFQDGKYRFSEISYLAGTYKTDWSWAPLLVDFDNDGWKDLLITNGFRKDVTNLDFIFSTMVGMNPFGTEKTRKEMEINAMKDLPPVKLPNYMFHNNKDLTFSDVSSDWGIDKLTFTNGTAFTDLDNDGDLDIVISNIDQNAVIFENRLQSAKNKKDAHYLRIGFDRSTTDADRFGLKVWAYHGKNHQFFDYTPYRGYKSTMDPEIHIGLGSSTSIDTLILQWPDGRLQKLYQVPADTLLTARKENGTLFLGDVYLKEFPADTLPIRFQDVTGKLGIEHKHKESSPVDLNQTFTLLHNLSQQNPTIAVGDINGDGLDDFYTGGDPGYSGSFFIQQPDHRFKEKSFDQDPQIEDMGALLFDADNDGDQDLYVVSGGSTKDINSGFYQDRIYINDGHANFTRDVSALPDIHSSGSCVIAGDYDLDGDLDLFAGGKIFPGRYPAPPKSFLLENNHGKFSDKSDLLDDTGGHIGVVNSALWSDVNNDGHPDLIIVGEWMPVKVFINDGKSFTDDSGEYGTDDLAGWWNSISGADLDNDGDIDYVVGNYGLNSYFKASQKEPVEIYAKDFDNNGSFDPIVTHYIQGKSYIVHPKGLLTAQIPAMQSRFRTYETYGTTPFKDSFLPQELNGAIHLKCTQMQTLILENIDNKMFKSIPLPLEAQFSPVFGIIFRDFNQDHLTDILLSGNSYADETITGYYDASYGTLLINKGNFIWEIPEQNQINLVMDDDIKAMNIISLGAREAILTASDNGFIHAYEWLPESNARRVRLNTDDWFMEMTLPDGHVRKTEFYYGSGYLSQNSREIFIPPTIGEIKIMNYAGKSQKN